MVMVSTGIPAATQLWGRLTRQASRWRKPVLFEHAGCIGRCTPTASRSPTWTRRAPSQAREQELRRNAHLKRMTEQDALAALLCPASCAALSGMPFVRLPTELQLHMLSFLVLLLSAAQCIHVCVYAAARATLLSAAGLGFLVSMLGGYVAGWGCRLWACVGGAARWDILCI
ncbi:hypothetical protein B0H21DRAFT_765987 [Amylocystis lapponica]|nr:hypothetical protein B0H21DRAFT_767379 [Amylocystis lapponica]KAH9922558.1 hypothetical protein B0H21DRAFT_765987 [Amylocystis lapponica]